MLLIAPTGAGKTLAGFLPSLVVADASAARFPPGSAFTGIHTLYISPLKALAVDIERNLMKPVGDMGLPVRIENRTGDTPQAQAPAPEAQSAGYPADDAGTGGAAARQRRGRALLQGPEICGPRRAAFARHLQARASAVARPCPAAQALRPDCRRSAFRPPSPSPMDLQRWLVAPGGRREQSCRADHRDGRRAAGHLDPSHRGARPLGRAFGALCHRRHLQGDRRTQDHAPVRQHPQPGRACCSRNSGRSTTTTCRSRCITARSMSASAARSRRRCRKTGCAPSSPPRRSISASTGAMSISSSMSARRRAPRALPSASAAPTTAWTSRAAAILVPANRFEVMECQAALDANYIGAQDTPPVGRGALDVLAQHVLGMACAAPVRSAGALRRNHQRLALCRSYLGDLRAHRRFRRDRRLCAAHL